MTTVNVNAKSKKDELFAAVQKLQAQLQEAKANHLDPAAEAKMKAETATVSKAEKTVQASVSTILNSIGGDVANLLAKAAEQIEASNNEYMSVDEAIKLKRKELAELHGIEEALLDLAALVNTQAELKAKNEAADAERIAATRATLDDLNAEILTKRAEFEAKIKADEAALKELRKKDQEEYEYNVSRTRKIEADKWEDQKAAEQKAHEAKMAAQLDDMNAEAVALDAREAAVKAREDAADDLQAKVDGIPSQIEMAVNAAVAAKEKSLQTSFNIEKGYLKKESESAAALAEANHRNVVERLNEANAKNADLQEKLNAAYQEIKDMATKTVESAGNARTIASMEQMLNNRTGTTK